MNARSALTIAILAAVSSCRSPGPHADGLYDDLGGHQREITTSSPLAQRWFDQGLVLMYAFNHDEAIRCFQEAARIDPQAAMPWWGIACASGPHINNPAVPPERDAAGREAIARARELAGSAAPVEQALITAQALRWGPAPPSDRRPLDEAYAEAMRSVEQRFPEDADVAALTAEALMDLQPWDLWTRDGQPKGRATEIIATIERALALQPSNPLANHLHVHATEASPEPARGLPSADRLRDLVPGAGHLVHMPAHTYLRTGRMADASQANVRALAADAKHARRFPRDGFYRVYMAHNAHFLAFSSMMEGRSEAALAAGRRMLNDMPAEFLAAAGPLADGFLPVVVHVLVRFGMWDEILREPAFADDMIVANGVRRYARGVALNALGRGAEAEAELRELDALLARLDDRPIGNNPAKLVMQIPRHTLAGEIAFARGLRDEGLLQLKEAVALEDQLVYDEPPDWMMPARHTLGAMLLEAARWADAQRAFEEDLRAYPENGWSLFGLTRALRARGREEEARSAEARFRIAWSRADVKIHSPCLCQPGSGPAVLAVR